MLTVGERSRRRLRLALALVSALLVAQSVLFGVRELTRERLRETDSTVLVLQEPFEIKDKNGESEWVTPWWWQDVEVLSRHDGPNGRQQAYVLYTKLVADMLEARKAE